MKNKTNQTNEKSVYVSGWLRSIPAKPSEMMKAHKANWAEYANAVTGQMFYGDTNSK